jgi:hypothetical protein
VRRFIVRRVSNTVCDYIPNAAPGVQTARLACIRKLHPGWDPSTVHPHGAGARRPDRVRRQNIADKYASMGREYQIQVVNGISSRDRAVLAVHLALTWYLNQGQSGAASHCFYDPSPPRGPGDRFGILKPRKDGSVIRADTVWALLCVAERRAARSNGEWGYSTRRHMLGPDRLQAVSSERDVVLA